MVSALCFLTVFLIIRIKAQCGNYTNCTDCVNDDSSGFVSCEWHSIDDYCYNWYQQSVNDDDDGITDVTFCPENELTAEEAAAVIIVLVFTFYLF